MADYLVYLTVGYNPEFAKLVDLCVKSILATNDNSKIDICIMCDEHYIQYIRHLPVKLHITNTNSTPVVSSMRKLEVFNIPLITNYKKVLFLDGDILVTKSLIPLFENAKDASKLYVFEETQYEKNPHTSIYFSHLTYSPEELKILEDNNIKGFNCGQFIFTPTQDMKGIFSTIIAKMNKFEGQYHYEQSFMNVFFNMNHHLTDRTMLQEHVQIYPEYKTQYPSKTIIHFTGTTEYSKLERMMSIFT